MLANPPGGGGELILRRWGGAMPQGDVVDTRRPHLLARHSPVITRYSLMLNLGGLLP